MIEPITENRSQARTHLFVAATLAWANGSFAGRLRNVSPQGAMIEIKAAPQVGERAKLIRGSLNADGIVVWRMGIRLGLRFDNPVDVSDWLPTNDGRQQHVDDVVHQIKNALEPPKSASCAEETRDDRCDLTDIADRLDSLGNALSADPLIIQRHASHLPILDVASQKLRNLSR